MKIKNFIIIMFAVIIFSASADLVYAEKKSDPIGNSFIINNLQMESDTPPALTSQESADGEIIFDDAFDDSIIKKNKLSTSKNIKSIIKKMQNEDKKLHFKEYRIKKNENLWAISKKFNIPLKKLIEINNISKPELLKENDTILTPSRNGIFYKIKKGDSLTKIAKNYNVEIELIAEHNNIDGRKIIAGKKIFLPDASELIIKPDIIKEKTSKQIDRSENIAENDNKKEKSSNDKVFLSWPLKGPITSGFGVRTHPFSGKKRFHCGLDIGAEVGTVIKSAGEGKVIFSGWKEAYGNMIVISHKNNYLTIYSHNSKNLVDVNEKITKGQKIALSGKTGAVTGAHLHFEVRKGIVPLNPSRILK